MADAAGSAPIVVFDLDGTLVETARTMIGGGARTLIERGLQAAGRASGTTEVSRLYDDFVAHYGEHLADRSQPFPGAIAAIEELAERGCRFAICTNKLEWLSVRLLQALGIAGHFSAICGQDTFGLQKPHPDILLKTIDKAGGHAARAVMVGDSLNDIAV